MPKIVVVDTDFDSNDIEVEMAAKAGIEIALFQDRSPEAIIEHAADADGVVTSYGNFPARCSRRCPTCRW